MHFNYIRVTVFSYRCATCLNFFFNTAKEERYKRSLQQQQNIADIEQEFDQNLKEDSSNPVIKQLTECYLQDVKVGIWHELLYCTL